MNTTMTSESAKQKCPICGATINWGAPKHEQVEFSSPPKGTLDRLYARVCKYAKRTGCINKPLEDLSPNANDHYYPKV